MDAFACGGAIALLVCSKSLSLQQRLAHPRLRKHTVSVEFVRMIAHAKISSGLKTYLASGGMQHANILGRNNVL